MNNIPDFTIEKEPKKSKSQAVGKQFEKDFKSSIPDNVFYYRFKDGTASWGGSQDNTRFQSKNICDEMLYHKGTLYLLELKTVKGKSFSFNNVRDNQIKELEKAATHYGIIAGFIINFRDIEKTVFIDVKEFIDMMNRSSKKSFNQDDLKFHKYTEISSKKLKVHYRYDIEKFLCNVIPF